MASHLPSFPATVTGYWRPWKEEANYWHDYLDYVRDGSLVKYGADTVGKYINQASQEQVQAINKLGQSIGIGMNVLSNQMSDVNKNISFLNQNLSIQIEQQKLSNLLLQNIAELLRVPDSEKERQHSIELGIKFFVNASKDADLYADALEELLKAESLMKQDYFVLHRIGCIYLHVEKFINPEKALDYFLRAAKYASVESAPSTLRLANVLTNNFNTTNTLINSSEQAIGLLTAESYEKAAFAAYILGKFEEAVNYQSKSLKFTDIAQNRFNLTKYLIRSGRIEDGIKNLRTCIETDPIYAIAAFKEIDLINEPEVLKLIAEKNKQIDGNIYNLIERFKKIGTITSSEVINYLSELYKISYELKVSEFKSLEQKANSISEEIELTKKNIDSYIKEVERSIFITFDNLKIENIITELNNSKNLPLEKMCQEFFRIKEESDSDILKIGSIYAGGKVFYIDNSSRRGLVFAEIPDRKAIWGYSHLEINANGNGLGKGIGLDNTKKIVELAGFKSELEIQGNFWKKELKEVYYPIDTAAKICKNLNLNGYADWYLPTHEELKLIHSHRYVLKISGFSYWSSTENSEGNAHCCNFRSDSGVDDIYGKFHEMGVIAVREF